MQTARAMVSRGRFARVRIAWTRRTEEFVKDVDDGMRFVRWTAGPRRSESRTSPAENRISGHCRRELTFECEDGGGVGRLDSGT